MIWMRDLPTGAQEVDAMAIKKTALLLDHELVAQVKELLGTTTTTETIAEAMREVIRVQGRARHFERMRRREQRRVIATHLADASAWAQLHRERRRRPARAAARGRRRRHVRDHRPRDPRRPSTTRRRGPRPRPSGPCSRGCRWTTPSSIAPCRCRASWRSGCRRSALVVAAAAERAGLVLLHHDDAYDRIAAVTGPADRADRPLTRRRPGRSAGPRHDCRGSRAT